MIAPDVVTMFAQKVHAEVRLAKTQSELFDVQMQLAEVWDMFLPSQTLAAPCVDTKTTKISLLSPETLSFDVLVHWADDRSALDVAAQVIASMDEFPTLCCPENDMLTYLKRRNNLLQIRVLGMT